MGSPGQAGHNHAARAVVARFKNTSYRCSFGIEACSKEWQQGQPVPELVGSEACGLEP